MTLFAHIQADKMISASLVEAIDEDGNLVLADRRRPGRANQACPELLPLLRRAESVEVPELPLFIEQGHRLGTPLLGIAIAVALSVPLWGVILFVGWILVH